MSMGDLISIHPTELKFPFELKKQSSCSMQLANKTDHHVAFKVKTTNPKKYCVRPNSGIILPGSSCSVTVTMQAQREAPADMQCRDKFLLQSVIAPDSDSANVTPEMFVKEEGKVVDEFKLRVIYIPANPPSPVPEGSEEGSSPRESALENGNHLDSMLDEVAKSLKEPEEESTETHSVISKLTEENAFAIQQNQTLRQELAYAYREYLPNDIKIMKNGKQEVGQKAVSVPVSVKSETMRKENSKKHLGGASFLFVMLIGLLGMLVGYFVNQ